MTELPQAHVPSWRRWLPFWWKALGMFLVIGATWLTCRYVRSYRPSQTAGSALDLKTKHAHARRVLREAGVAKPTGLDPILARLLERNEDHVQWYGTRTVDTAAFERVVPTFAVPGADVAPIAPMFDTAGRCESGFDKAFEQMIGGYTIRFDEALRSPLQLRVRYTIAPSGTAYTAAFKKRIFPGIAISGELELVDGATVLAKFPFDVKPDDKVGFSSDMLAGFSKSGDDAAIASGLVVETCKQIGFLLAKDLTGWSPPVEPIPGLADIVAECESGGTARACLDAAANLIEKDPKTAARLFGKGCRSHSIGAGEACIRAGELAQKDEPVVAKLMFDAGCEANEPRACLLAGERELARVYSNEQPSHYEVDEALDRLVRGCDLGYVPACVRAAELLTFFGLGGTPLPSASVALSRKAGVKAELGKGKRETAVLGVSLDKSDTIFDVRWGDWFNMDFGHAVVWIASTQEADTVRARMTGRLTRVYAKDAVPPGPTLPANAKSAWAVFSRDTTWRDDRPCGECKTKEASDPLYAMGCTCLPIP